MDIKYHNGNFAACVKDPMLPEELTDKQWQDGIEYVNEQVESWLDELQERLKEQYPSFAITVSWTGRSGGWFELDGAWELEQVSHSWNVWRFDPDCWPHTKHRERIITKYILPAFYAGVDEILEAHYSLWQRIAEGEA
jgi:hypothetical protein